MRSVAGLAVLFLLSLSSAARAADDPCAALANLSLPDTKITLAERIDAGAFPPPPNTPPDETGFYKVLPAMCRVVAQITPSADSAIEVEVWMPEAGWNGKFRGRGNGGFAGDVDYAGLAISVGQGYASASTDTGHTAVFTDAAWAVGHPEKVIDFGYRGIHEMTQKAKTIIAAYYGSAPKHAYFGSCSDGGREALMEAQRFPEDYDGILAGAPAYDWTRLQANAAYNAQVLMSDPVSYLPASKLPAISAAVLAACDAKDGVADGILNDPRQCRFDPATLVCKGPETDSCLTAPQAATLKTLYAGSRSAKGKQIFPGYLPGAELGPGGWLPWIVGEAPGQSLMFAFANGYFSNMVYENPSWNYKTFNVDAGLKAATEKTEHALNATDPNLKPFLSRGGKLILYHGWNDPAISSLSTIDYYKKLTHVTGRDLVESSVRLFMVPGMQHCSGGPGATSFGQSGWVPEMGPDDPQRDIYLALEQWVENGQAPQQVIARKYEGETRHVTMTRPLCPYPQIAKYKGSGETTDAGNFVCAPGPK